MNTKDLNALVTGRLNQPGVQGTAGFFFDTPAELVQKSFDGRQFALEVQAMEGLTRCTLTDSAGFRELYCNIELHEDGLVNVDCREGCSLTIESRKGYAVVTR